MTGFFRNAATKIQQWMSGRYGVDELSRAMYIAVLIGLLLSCIPGMQILSLPTFLLLIYSTVRTYSRNIEKRREERTAYLRFTGKIKGWFTLRKKMWQERKTHKYIRCMHCKTMLRVPRGKGKIKITCSKCHNEIVKKT